MLTQIFKIIYSFVCLQLVSMWFILAQDLIDPHVFMSHSAIELQHFWPRPTCQWLYLIGFFSL